MYKRMNVKQIEENVFEVSGSGLEEHDDALTAAGEHAAAMQGEESFLAATWTDRSRESVMVRL